jgi:hypothetical protein
MELVFKDGRAVTNDGQVGVTMLIVPKEDIDSSGVIYRYFEYVAHFLHPAQRVEWDAESMQAVLPKDTAELLVKRGYARAMREDEVTAYNKAETATQPEPKPVEVEPAKEPPAVVEEVAPVVKPPEKTEPAKPASKKPKRGD